MVENGKKIFFENASFLKREFQFEMVHPDVGNYCQNTGRAVWVKSRGHIREEARAGAKKTCKRCKVAFVLKSA